MLEDRRSEILRALVEEHIATGEAVSSRSIVEKTRLNVSTATVRNDLAALEQEGFVVQPHRSSGRIPTAAAYRYYVDHLGPGRLRATSQAKIHDFFGEVHLELSKLLAATSDLLAEITDLPAVVVSPDMGGDPVRAVHAVQVLNDQILVVIVTEGGRIHQHRGRTRVPVTPLEVEKAQRLLSEEVVGIDLGDDFSIPDETTATLSNPELEAILTVSDCIHLAGSASKEVFVGGTQRLPGVWSDTSSLRQVLDVLEREAEVMKLVAAATETSIHIGSELPVSHPDMAVVARRYESGTAGGSVGVIGPMRMNYRRAITAVEEVTRELEDLIASENE